MPTETSPSHPLFTETREICAICGKDAGTLAFCHFFDQGQRIVLCTPECAEVFLHRGDDAQALTEARAYRDWY